jgi:hypothetical protein
MISDNRTRLILLEVGLTLGISRGAERHPLHAVVRPRVNEYSARPHIFSTTKIHLESLTYRIH